jgi:TolB-like protein/predicted Ser/Thr protein kinase
MERQTRIWLSESPIMIGQRLLHYEIVGKLGEGGMGVVYKARDTHLDRFVAIKVLPPEKVADPARKARFVQEAKAASALNHPNIVTIHDISAADGVDFIAMEYVAGGTLDQLIPCKGMRLNEALKIAIQITDALASAHMAGIIHRDLKPANIMVDEHGRAKVLDFGLAKLAERVISENDATVTIGTQTNVGTIVGTAAYMSPEQARGEKVDARTDLFAFGAVLYQMVSGKQAFCGPSTAVLLDAILNRQPPTLRTVEPQTPASLEAIVGKALEKDRELRYQSAADVLADLKRLLRETESRQVAAAPLPNAAGTARRRLFFAAAAATLLGVAGVAWFELRGTAHGRIEAVAVLPLSGLSADPGHDYFAEGMTEALTVELAQIGSFRVIDQGSAAQFRDAQRPVQEAARKLGVDAVVTASVMWADERVRIAAKLVEANTGRYLWAKSYERDFRDVLALQREVAAAIAGEIRAKVTPEQKSRLASARRVDPEAYELYLKGRQTAGGSKESFERKIAFLEESIRKDPSMRRAAPRWHPPTLRGRSMASGRRRKSSPRRGLPR